jgi:hypothetical protein
MYLSAQTVRPRGGTYYLGAPLSRRPVFVRQYLGYLGQPINASGQAAVNASAAAGQIVKADGSAIYVPGTADCAQAPAIGKALITAGATTAGGLLLKIGAASGNPIVLGAGAAAELAGLVFNLIFGHHAAAVKKEQSVLCAAVPAANQSFQVIDQAVQAGQFTPQQGMTALDSLASGFQSAVSPILKMNNSQCNAACVMVMAVKAVVAAKKQQYAALAAQQAAAIQSLPPALQPAATALQPVASAVSSAIAPVQQAIASAGLPSWVLPAAGFLLLWKLV